jgi:putative tryptophan/tyrosine transport system substrate-binding protein
MAIHIRRRQFIAALSGVWATWPLAARAQQPTMPVVGFLHDGETSSDLATAFRNGLSEASFVEGRNVGIEYRWANGQYDQVPHLVADLVRRQVAVIATTGAMEAALAAKQATVTIPIVFTTGGDPVKAGLVAALNKPGGNITGVTTMNALLGSKWVGLMHDLLPRATRFALLVNPRARANSAEMVAATQDAATAIGLQLEVVYAGTSVELETALATAAQRQAGALMIVPNALFLDRRAQIAELALRLGLPAIYVNRAFPEAGGLMSYGSDFTDTFRQVGVYCGRILKGAKPADLPVQQQTQFRFVINLKTVKALGLNISDNLLTLADEVIE